MQNLLRDRSEIAYYFAKKNENFDCCVPRCRKKYNTDLKHMTANDNMKSRMKKIDKKVDKLPVQDEYLPLSAAARSKK